MRKTKKELGVRDKLELSCEAIMSRGTKTARYTKGLMTVRDRVLTTTNYNSIGWKLRIADHTCVTCLTS